MLRVPRIHRVSLSGSWAVLAMVSLVACGGSAPPAAPAITALSRADHAKYFTIDTGSHAKADCNACHGDFDSFRQFRCTTCHVHDQAPTDAAHVGINPAYVYGDTTCYQCHNAASYPRFNHTPYFPIRQGDKHVGIQCGACHLDNGARAVVDCLTCHDATTTDPKHTAVPDYARTSSTCLKCHADSQVFRVVNHLPFAISSGFPHNQTGCVACHSQPRLDKPFGQDFTLYNCLKCHASADLAPTHSAFPGYKYESPNCTTSGCHQGGTKP